ncbi:MAG: hypothetical protein OXU19_16845 [bacterium]|nr:hypothetical protein [bacterium]
MDSRAQEEVPDPQGGVALRLFGVHSQFIAPGFLSFGSDTVLAAWRRHGHLERKALQAPEAFAEYTGHYDHCFAAPPPQSEAIVRRIARRRCAGGLKARCCGC